MKFAIAALLLFPFSVMAQSVTEETDLVKEGLKGEVKSFSLKVYEPKKKGKNIRSGEQLMDMDNTVKTFNKNGMFTLVELKLDSIKTEYTYNDKGLKVSEQVTDLITGAKYSGSSLTYNLQNKLIEVINTDGNDNITARLTTKYDINGNIIDGRHHAADGTVLITRKIEYDANNNETQVLIYGSTDKLTSITTNEYDENNNKIFVTQYNSSGFPTSYTHYKYEGKNVVEELLLNADSVQLKRKTWAFDAKGNETAYNEFDSEDNEIIGYTKKYTDGVLTSLLNTYGEYHFDKYGNRTETVNYESDGTKSSVKMLYDYDKQGNWTQFILIDKTGTPLYVVKREITYF